MEPLIESFLKIGSTGIVGAVLWVIAKRFMDETVSQMTARIQALEVAVHACEADRKTLHSEIVSILRKETK